MLNAATYGQTIPTIIGMTRSAILVIWAANLRKGHSGKKGKKKGPPTYVENCDFMLGSNPIEGVLSVWSNNTNRYTIGYASHLFSGGLVGSYTVPDAHFYFVIGVTVEVEVINTANDYGNPVAPNGIAVMDAAVGDLPLAAGYAPGDTFNVVGGGGTGGIGSVVTVDGFGAPLTVAIEAAGTGYFRHAFNCITTVITGSGNGNLKVNVEEVGTYVDLTQEYPLWNAAQHGPDLANAAGYRWYPYIYSWRPSDGATVTIQAVGSGAAIPNNRGNVRVYYAQLNSNSHLQPPITFNRMTFEQSLGNGTEYSDAGLTSQQIIYPFYAGLGSSDMDLGTTGLLADWRVETKGSHCLYSTGDADFADMIEDVIKSGQIQTGVQLGLIQRGVNCNDLPGLVQRAQQGDLEPTPNPVIPYQQPNAAGAILIDFTRWRVQGGTNPTISDDSGVTWNPVMIDSWFGLWYGVSPGWPALNKVAKVFNGSSFAYDLRDYIFEASPDLDTIEATNTLIGTGGGDITISITVSKPSLLLLFSEDTGDQYTITEPLWSYITTNNTLGVAGASNGNPTIMQRYVSAAGTYTWTEHFLLGTNYKIAIIALSASQPSQFPKTLGNIIDDDSLNLTRLQCRANGLYGSIWMNAQRPATDWLEEFYTCANAAPVWSGFKLKSIPYSEVTAVGNGVVYTPPTNPVADLDTDDMIDPGKDAPVVKVTRTAQVDANNVMQLEHVNRGNDYNTSTVSEPESSSITILGPRKDAPKSLHEIQDPSVARKILAVLVRRKVTIRNQYEFTLQGGWLGLEAMDVVTITEPLLGLDKKAIRLTSVEEDKDHNLNCVAEEFIFGLNSPSDLPATPVTPNNPNSNATPSSVNTPIIFEPVPALSQFQNQRYLCIVVSDPDPNYGGCIVNVSTDGTTYNPLPGNSMIDGNAVTGVTVGTWAAGTTPDTTNDLAVDLTESLGVLATYSNTQEDQNLFPSYVAGGTGGIPYELMGYAVATLTSANHYTLKATGTGHHLNRALFGAPNSGGVGVSHAGGSRFAFLGTVPSSAKSGGKSVASNGVGGVIFVPMADSWIGVTLYFKFQAFNQLGGGLQDISTCTVYTYSPTGTVGSVNPGGVPPIIVAVN